MKNLSNQHKFCVRIDQGIRLHTMWKSGRQRKSKSGKKKWHGITEGNKLHRFLIHVVRMYWSKISLRYLSYVSYSLEMTLGLLKT